MGGSAGWRIFFFNVDYLFWGGRVCGFWLGWVVLVLI